MEGTDGLDGTLAEIEARLRRNAPAGVEVSVRVAKGRIEPITPITPIAPIEPVTPIEPLPPGVRWLVEINLGDLNKRGTAADAQ